MLYENLLEHIFVDLILKCLMKYNIFFQKILPYGRCKCISKNKFETMTYLVLFAKYYLFCRYARNQDILVISTIKSIQRLTVTLSFLKCKCKRAINVICNCFIPSNVPGNVPDRSRMLLNISGLKMVTKKCNAERKSYYQQKIFTDIRLPHGKTEFSFCTVYSVECSVQKRIYGIQP